MQRLVRLLSVCGCLAAAFFFTTAPALAAHPTIIIDAGHGGHDRGGIPGQRIGEKGMTLDVARRLQSTLRQAGFRTVMTRSDDTFIPLPTRTAIANRYRDGVFVSIHFNAAPRSGASGIETYYYASSAAKLADRIHARVVRAAGTENRRVRRRGFYVLRKTRIPAVLVECGFLTNPAESNRILTAAHRQRLANAIAQGIQDRY